MSIWMHLVKGSNGAPFCPNNHSLFDVWLDQGLSQCFLNTFASSVLMFLMVLSILEILAFWKKAITWRREHKPKPFWFRVQTLLHLCVLALHITRIVVHGALGPKPLHGYLELSTCFYSIAYIVAMMCLYVERTRTLATRTRKGHGTLLLLFWTIATMTEVLAVVSFQSPLWWFDLEDTVDKVDFGLWISRLFCNLLLFAFGLRAPGLPPRGYALLINDGPSPVDPHQVSHDVSSSGSIVIRSLGISTSVGAYGQPEMHIT